MTENFLEYMKLGNGRLYKLDDAKFLLNSGSFTPQDLLDIYKMTDEILCYVLAQKTIRDKAILN